MTDYEKCDPCTTLIWRGHELAVEGSDIARAEKESMEKRKKDDRELRGNIENN